MGKISLTSHPDYPALPAQAVDITPDTGCAACPLAQTDGHKTCNTFKMINDPEVTPENRIDLDSNRRLQGQLHRRAFDLDGIVGSYNGATIDNWYHYNAGKQINFAYFSSWQVTSVSGDTLTLTIPDGDARQVTLATWSERSGGQNVPGYYDVTSVQPLDMIEFQAPSRAQNLKAKILQVTAATGTTITIVIDKAVDICTSFYGVDGQDDPEFATAKIYQYGHESEKWLYQNEPHFFFGRHTSKVISSDSLPGDKIWKLESEVIAPPPVTELDPLHPTFLLEAYDSASGTWKTINESNTRLHIKPGYAAYALGVTQPEGSIRDAQSDLSIVYSKFRASYYVKVDQGDAACKIIGFDRCYNSRTDTSKSVGNYGTELGAGITKDGKHVYCSERIYEEYTEIDDLDRTTNPPSAGTDGVPDRVTVSLHHPANLALYPSTGACIQYGYCQKMENSIDHLGSQDSPFLSDYEAWLMQLLFGCDKAMRQRYALADNYYVERVNVPGFFWLLGYYKSMTSSGGFSPRTYPRGNASWFPVAPTTITDDDGNETLQVITGIERGYLATPDVDQDRRALLPANVDGYTTKRNPLIPGTTTDDDLLEWVGAQVERDSLKIKDNRGLSTISVALPAEDIISPNYRIDTNDLQQHSRSTFQIDAASGDGIITILPYRQETKPETSLGTRTIHAVKHLDGVRYQIEFENATRTFSRINSGSSDIGDSYNKIFTVLGGGAPPILPYENQGLNSYDGDKTTGSRNAGAAPLDVIEVMGTRLLIESVTPHGGTEALTWGSRQVVDKGAIGGFFEYDIHKDSDGNAKTPLTNIIVNNLTDSVDFTIFSDDEKPELLENQCWYDGGTRIYFSGINDGDSLALNCSDRENFGYTQYFTIHKSFTVTTETPYADYSGASSKSITIGTATATIVDGGTASPAAGSVRINEVSDNITLTFAIANAPDDWRMVLAQDDDAEAPQDDWAVGGEYLSIGKLRDIAVVHIDQHDGSDFLAGNIITGETATIYKSAAVFLPQSNMALLWTPYATDDWIPFDVSGYTPNGASGTIRIKAATIATLPDAKICFRANVQMVDNRGFFPASILNKLSDMLDSMQWVTTSMGGGYQGAEIDFHDAAARGEGFVVADPDADDAACQDHTTADTGPPFSIPSVPGNYVYMSDAQDGSTTAGSVQCEVGFGVHSSAMGIPLIIQNLPDGAEILEAKIIVTATNAIAKKSVVSYTHNCDDGFIESVDEDEDPFIPDYTILGFSDAENYEIVGHIPGGQNGAHVVDATEIMGKIFQERGTGKYAYGLAIVFMPAAIGMGSASGAAGMVPPRPPGAVRVGCNINQDCGRKISYGYFVSNTQYHLSWSNLFIGDVALKIDYHGADKLDQVQGRFPSFRDL